MEREGRGVRGSGHAKKILFSEGKTWHIHPRNAPLPHPSPRRREPQGGREKKTRKDTMEQTKETELWDRLLADMQSTGEVGEYWMDTYFSKMRLLQDTGTKLIIEYERGMLIEWVEISHSGMILNAVSRVLKAARELQFVEAGAGEQPAPEAEQEAPAAEKPARAPRSTAAKSTRRSRSKPLISGLNEDYRFENFIVGDNSRLAYAAARRVAESAAENTRAFNPLFIYGDSGMGKTHLLQAIGNEIRRQDEDTQVLYVTGEEFTNGYIDALTKKGEALSNFRRRYRRADVLLIDDIQFLAKKGKTQEEFFHTFNALFESGKQVVLCADCPASRITNMETRLCTRFEQGMTVCLESPCYETRLAILRSKARRWRSELISDEVLQYLARNISSSVRSLEGGLTRISSIAAFSHRSPSVQEARAQLSDLLDRRRTSKVTIEDIQNAVAEEFRVRVADLNGRRRTAGIAHSRQVAMYLARKLTQNSLQEIGAAFGGRDHGTVIHATRTVEEKMGADPELGGFIRRMEEEMGCGAAAR